MSPSSAKGTSSSSSSPGAKSRGSGIPDREIAAARWSPFRTPAGLRRRRLEPKSDSPGSSARREEGGERRGRPKGGGRKEKERQGGAAASGVAAVEIAFDGEKENGTKMSKSKQQQQQQQQQRNVEGGADGKKKNRKKRRPSPKDLPPPSSFGPPDAPRRFVIAPDAFRDGLGHGSFGAVVVGVDTAGNAGEDPAEEEENGISGTGGGVPVAIKLEVRGTSTAQNEADMMARFVRAIERGRIDVSGGRLRLIPPQYAGPAGEHHEAIVMPLMGRSVSDTLRRAMRHKEGLPQTLALAVGIQAIEALEQLHRADLVHRDIKPGNMVFGPPGSGKEFSVFLVDFGLTEPWEPEERRREARRAEGGMGAPHVCGTAKYASRNTHAGCPPSPRDDLESVCYMLISHLRAPEKLPWEHVIGLDHDGDDPHGNDFRRAARSKLQTTARELCRGLDPEVMEVLCRVRSTRFDQMPDHEGLIALLRRALRARQAENDDDDDESAEGEEEEDTERAIRQGLTEIKLRSVAAAPSSSKGRK